MCQLKRQSWLWREDYVASTSNSLSSHKFSVVMDLASDLQGPGRKENLRLELWWRGDRYAYRCWPWQLQLVPSQPYSSETVSGTFLLQSPSMWLFAPPIPGKGGEVNSWLDFRYHWKSGTGCFCYGLRYVPPNSHVEALAPHVTIWR